MTHVDPTLVAAAACAGVMVAMVSYRVRCSAHAFHPDHLERSTCAFMATLGEQPNATAVPWLAAWEQGRPGAELATAARCSRPDHGPRRLSAALCAARCVHVGTGPPSPYVCAMPRRNLASAIKDRILCASVRVAPGREMAEHPAIAHGMQTPSAGVDEVTAHQAYAMHCATAVVL